MGPFEMVVAIVAVACAAGVVNNWLKTRTMVSGEHVERLIERRLGALRDLERRIEVVEKIVTDRKYELTEQIRRL